MYSSIFHVHSGIRYLVLLMLIIVIGVSFYSLIKSIKYSKFHKNLVMTLLVVTHAQFIMGLILYFISPLVIISEIFSNDEIRYWGLEHIVMMTVAVGLITASRIASKKHKRSKPKFIRLLFFNTLALVFILAALFLSGRGII